MLKSTIGLLIFAIVCCLGIVQGWLQCFDPARWQRIRTRLFPRSVSWYEKYLEKQARNPSLLYRLGGFLVMVWAAFMLVSALVIFASTFAIVLR